MGLDCWGQHQMWGESQPEPWLACGQEIPPEGISDIELAGFRETLAGGERTAHQGETVL